VDSFDAITSDRPYRKAAGFEYALDEIVKNRGGQFDGDVVDAFLAIPREKWEIIRKMVDNSCRRIWEDCESLVSA
jgi:putative two-component system response regulator